MRDESLVEAAVKTIVLCFIMYLLASTWYFTFLQYRNGSSSANTSDDMSLAGLAQLSFNDTSTNSQLRDPGFWSTVLAESGRTTTYLVHDTIFGLMQSSKQWNTLFSENMDNPPPWLSQGLPLYLANFFAKLDADAIGAGNAAAAARVMKNFTSYVAGLSAAGVDFASYNGLSALKQYLSTGSVTESAATTFPGQIYLLYSLAFNSSYPEEIRAQFLGKALAITGFVIVTAGAGHFSDKFEGMLSKLNLLEAWPKIKAYLKDMVSESPGAAYEATLVLEALAKKFPTTFTDVAGFTSDRIDLMIQSLKDKGLGPEAIKEKVAELAKTADDAKDELDVAEAADEISYGNTGTVLVRVDGDRQIYLHADDASKHYIRSKFLKTVIPGFNADEVTALKTTVHKGNELLSSYHVYQGGGDQFRPALPKQHVNPGDVVPISFELLPVESFVKGVSSYELVNSALLRWVADEVIVKDFTLTGSTLEIHVLQDSPYVALSDFTIVGNVERYPGVSTRYGGIYLEFSITDYVGGKEAMRLVHDGFSAPDLQLSRGGAFQTVHLVSYDGFRLSIVYGDTNSLATVYLHPPSELLYRLGDMQSYSGSYLELLTGRYDNAFALNSIEMVRSLEDSMLKRGSTYDVGRLGAEIAYVIADTRLGLKNIVLEEPSLGGRDLYTHDNKVAIQARLLRDLRPDKVITIQKALLSLVDKLREDYDNQSKMHDGYAILSYLDTDGVVKTIILEVPRS